MKHLRKGNIAFWRYDLPGKHFLSGEIEKVCGKSYPGPGHVEIKGYGAGYWFKPLFCLPAERGRVAHEVMERATAEHNRVVSRASDAYIETISPFLPKGITP